MMDIKKADKEDKKTKKTEEVEKNNHKKKEKASKRIYIGPNLQQLITYTVVEDEFPEHIKSIIKACSSVEKLFVKIDELAALEKRTKTKGTLEYRNYIKVIEFAQGKGE